MNKEEKNPPISVDNIYRLNGRVPLQKAIPFGLQHVLAMFVSNLAPVLIVCSAAIVRSTGEHLTSAEITQLLQCAMFAAGIGTCMQLYPIWKIGSRLPIVMGVSFTFLGSLLVICTNPDLGYEGMVGAVILGGIFEGLVGLSAKYWKRFLTPVVSACVVIAIGLSLLSVGMDSWGGGSGVEDFGAWYHLLVGAFTLVVCLVSRYLLKGVYKNLNILVGLVFGYLLAVIFTAAGVAPMVDFSGISQTIQEVGIFSIPKLVFFTSHKPVFDLGAFFTIAIVFLVSAAETTGATTAVCTGALGRNIKMEELQGSLAVDGFSSAISGCFGCPPLTSFSQNVGLVTMTGVINRFTIFTGALILILASLFPPLGAFFNSLPQAVLGGCTVMMFGSIMYEGIKMLKECVFDDRTMIIVSLSFCIGVGLTQTSGNFFSCFPQAVGDVFNGFGFGVVYPHVVGHTALVVFPSAELAEHSVVGQPFAIGRIAAKSTLGQRNLFWHTTIGRDCHQHAIETVAYAVAIYDVLPVGSPCHNHIVGAHAVGKVITGIGRRVCKPHRRPTIGRY